MIECRSKIEERDRKDERRIEGGRKLGGKGGKGKKFIFGIWFFF